MSGVFCGGCGEGNLSPDPGGRGVLPVACDLCGWTADSEGLPRTWPLDEASWTKRVAERTLLELEVRQTLETLRRLEEVPGVTRVWLAP